MQNIVAFDQIIAKKALKHVEEVMHETDKANASLEMEHYKLANIYLELARRYHLRRSDKNQDRLDDYELIGTAMHELGAPD